MQYDRNTIIHPKPDPLEKWVRLVCGALFGLVISLCIAWKLSFASILLDAGIVLGGMGLCARLALRHGDDFWHVVLKAFAGSRPWHANGTGKIMSMRHSAQRHQGGGPKGRRTAAEPSAASA